MFKAMVLGNCVKVSERQFPDIHKLVTEAASSIGMPHVPDVFIYSSGGLLNAFAVKFLGGKYIILYSGIVDNILRRKSPGELKSIISHELGHHAAGHTGLFKQILLIPALSVPILGTAYKRACEYTADRISYAVMNDANIVCQSLLTLSHGTLILANQISKNEFLGQESRIPGIMGFVFEISSGHPRLTRRIAAVEDFAAHYKA
jgi:Zn-dependent protease with chaperone function